LTGADIQLSFVLEAAAPRGGLGQQYPELTAFLDRSTRPRPAGARWNAAANTS
jgi:glutathione S-transferase